MTIKELLNQGIIMLKNKNIDSPKLKARILLQKTLGKSREYIIIYDNIQVTAIEKKEYINNITKVIQGEPIEYITKTKEFMKMNFIVNKDVLIPRNDTEVLVEETIKVASNIKNPIILDLCTGSGAIAVSLAKYIPSCKVYASDISIKALSIAKKNAQINEVVNNIVFIESNLFEKIKNNKFDIIVSNPPYIPKYSIPTLEKNVQKEPHLALDGGIDGLDFYRNIIQEAYKYLNTNGYLCLEIGYDQKTKVLDIIANNSKYIETYCKKDLCQNDRVIVTRIG